MWLPPVQCLGLWFYDHSSGHGAYAKEALLASHANKGPDWKGSVPAMRDGWFRGADGARKAQVMQFVAGDTLPRDLKCPPGVDPHADPAAAAAGHAAAALADDAPTTPPTEAELASAYKLFLTGCLQTLKKHNPGCTAAALQVIGQAKWAATPKARQLVFVGRVRAKAIAGPAKAADERVLQAGTPVPRVLWNRHKGLESILAERGLYPTAGLKGACQNEKSHAASNDCCCARLISVQPDFDAECSALQHLVEERIPISGTEMTSARHVCIFLPKFHCELNWIERFWGAAKAYTRTHCLYTLPGLRETVPIALSQDVSDLPAHLAADEGLPVCPLFLQRRHARISRQFMAQYRQGANASDAIKSVHSQRTSKRHRDPNEIRSRQVEARMAALANSN